MSSPLVSVLMTAYNVEDFIGEAIHSILNQTHENWELLIADDCSTDGTRKKIDQYNDPRIRVHHNETNIHYLRTRNKLVTLARGDFITLLDSDDTCVETRFEKQLEAFRKNPNLGMCGCLVRYVNRQGQQIPLRDSKPEVYSSIRKEIKSNNVFTGSTIMVRSTVWNSVGGYRDFFNSMGYEDYDLTSRIVQNYESINLQEDLYIYRQYPESTSKQGLLYNPFKLHGAKLVQHFIAQREDSGKDSLDVEDYPGIISYVLGMHKPFVDDPSTIYRRFMWSNLNRGFIHKALQSSLMAIWTKPFNWLNWKTLALLCLIRLRIVKE